MPALRLGDGLAGVAAAPVRQNCPARTRLLAGLGALCGDNRRARAHAFVWFHFQRTFAGRSRAGRSVARVSSALSLRRDPCRLADVSALVAVFYQPIQDREALVLDSNASGVSARTGGFLHSRDSFPVRVFVFLGMRPLLHSTTDLTS